jgi:polysaccharide deacetylase family protein (PEP-CTERM system associated)
VGSGRGAVTMKRLASSAAAGSGLAPGNGDSLFPGTALDSERPPLVLTFDVEDWHQLVQRRLGLADWDRRGPALPRQLHAILDTLDVLGTRATFFLLGMTARRYPELAAEIGRRGHEIACHGYAHRPVYTQSVADFRRDLDLARDVIGRITGRSPAGYRAPLFSINRDTPWAYDTLAEVGFQYDASQYDSPRISNRIRDIPTSPYVLQLPSGKTLWEFPIAVWRAGAFSLPVGGGSYWRVLPAPVLLHALQRLGQASPFPSLYFHPYEWDPRPLRVSLPPAASARQRLLARQRSLWRNSGRGRPPRLIHTVGERFRLVSCEQARASLACHESR